MQVLCNPCRKKTNQMSTAKANSRFLLRYDILLMTVVLTVTLLMVGLYFDYDTSVVVYTVVLYGAGVGVYAMITGPIYYANRDSNLLGGLDK